MSDKEILTNDQSDQASAPIVISADDIQSVELKASSDSAPSDQTLEVIAKDLQLNLPMTDLPLPDKLITVFTLVGGLGIVGSSLADIFSPDPVAWHYYLLRLVAGISFLAITYGIIHRERWAIWWYGFLVALAFFINPLLAFLPAAIVYYLYLQRAMFRPCIFDEWTSEGWRRLVGAYRSIRSSR